jgi:hypothetical protein
MTDIPSNPSSALPPDDGFSRYAAYERQKAASVQVNKAALLPALVAAGVSIIVVAFDGCGDSGQIEHVEARAGDTVIELPDRAIELAQADWNRPDLQRCSTSLRDAVETLAWDILSSTYGGWENNDGAYGEIVFDVGGGEIRLEFNQRYSDVECFEHTF